MLSSNELERTPGMAAVSRYTDGEPERWTIKAIVAGPTSGSLFPDISGIGSTNSRGVLGTESPGYLDHYANRVQDSKTEAKKPCPGYFVTGSCDNGHKFAKELLCGKEWCPTCGKDNSKMHLRRFARWLSKLYQCRSIGYFVFTIPPGARAGFRTKEKLSWLAKSITSGDKSQHIEGVLKTAGFSRGLMRWHYFGDKSTRYNPHLNVIVEGGRVSPKVLNQVKLAWAGILGVNQAVVNYSYTRKQAKMVHILKYATRATFHELAWDDSLAHELYNFRNNRSWGTWGDAPVWQLKGNSKFEHIEQLEKSLCPVCGHALKWGKAMPIAWLRIKAGAGGAKDLQGGYWYFG